MQKPTENMLRWLRDLDAGRDPLDRIIYGLRRRGLIDSRNAITSAGRAMVSPPPTEARDE